jgi:hypothetical protein
MLRFADKDATSQTQNGVALALSSFWWAPSDLRLASVDVAALDRPRRVWPLTSPPAQTATCGFLSRSKDLRSLAPCGPKTHVVERRERATPVREMTRCTTLPYDHRPTAQCGFYLALSPSQAGRHPSMPPNSRDCGRDRDAPSRRDCAPVFIWPIADVQSDGRRLSNGRRNAPRRTRGRKAARLQNRDNPQPALGAGRPTCLARKSVKGTMSWSTLADSSAAM